MSALPPCRCPTAARRRSRSTSSSRRCAGRATATAFNLRTIVEDITGTLAAAGCYSRRDAAIRSAVPEYGPGYRCKIVLPDVVRQPGYRAALIETAVVLNAALTASILREEFGVTQSRPAVYDLLERLGFGPLRP